MKKSFLVLIMCIQAFIVDAQVSRTIQVPFAGTLLYEIYPDMKTITDLTITGNINAVDFRIIRDSMPALKNLDLKTAIIDEYTGTDGTYMSTQSIPMHYNLYEIPQRAFYNKTNFESLILPDSTRSVGVLAFYRYSSPNPINLPKNLVDFTSGFSFCAASFTVDPENEAFAALDGVLYNKTFTTLIQVPISRTNDLNIPESVTTIKPNALNSCTSMSAVFIPQSVSSIMYGVFTNCNAQLSVDVNNITYSSLDGVLFNKAKTTLINIPTSKTGSYIIPETVTTVGLSSFFNCKNISAISIPQNVVSIGQNAFQNCTNLSLVRILTTTPPVITDNEFKNVNKQNCILQIPHGSYSLYSEATGWKSFTNIIEPISTNEVNSVTFTSAVLNGNIAYVGSTPYSAFGFCWNTSGNPTLTDSKIDFGQINAIGNFNYSLLNLTEGTTYYVRSFVIDDLGVQYGSQVAFTTQSIPDAAGLISGNTSVCQGQQNVTYSVDLIKNATSYIWTLPSGAVGTSTSNSITVNYEKNAVSGIVSVKGHNQYFDGTSSSLQVTVNPLPVNPGNISGDNSVCIGDSSVVYEVLPVDNATSYIWTLPTGVIGSSTTNSIRVKFTQNAVSGNITVKGHNDCGDGEVSVLPVAVNKLPAITVSDKTVICGETVMLANTADFVGNENFSYKWSPATGLSNDAIPNPTVVAINDITYTVTVTNENGCSKSAAVRINIKSMDKPQIGIVGVNSSNKNIVVWNKPVSFGIDSYSVYRETNVTDVYEKIGSIPYSELSVFVDNSSNPTVKSNKYRLSIVDKSGLETPLSEPHKTMHLTINKGQNNTWNLIWEPYTGFTPSTYNIYRGSTSTSLGFIDATSGSSTQFSDISAPEGDVYYQVEVISPVLVSPTHVKSTIHKVADSGNVSYNSSRSNIASNSLNGIIDIQNNYIQVYPNPAKNYFNISFEGGSVFEIQNLAGQVVYNGDLNNTKTVKTDNFKSGVYVIKFLTGKSIVYKKIIIE